MRQRKSRLSMILGGTILSAALSLTGIGLLVHSDYSKKLEQENRQEAPENSYSETRQEANTQDFVGIGILASGVLLAGATSIYKQTREKKV